MASYSSSQSSAGRNPLDTIRSTVVPPARASSRNSIPKKRPSGLGVPRNAKCTPGSYATIGDRSANAPIRISTAPASGSTSAAPMNQELRPGSGRDGVPDLLGRLVELQLVVVGELVRHRQPFSRSARDVVLGWTATTSR